MPTASSAESDPDLGPGSDAERPTDTLVGQCVPATKSQSWIGTV
ncbi:hypothetical protein [Frankia sp. R82]|nr:hypothetical protein [Frankia sp. R82]